ncbi:MAG: spore coat associated protein CotJA [Clostridia bacterium]
MNKCCNNCSCNCEKVNPALETVCDEVDECNCDCNMCNNYDKCNCGFEEEEEESVFPLNPMLGQSYVPIQRMNNTFTPCCGLQNGTIFPELVSPYYPCQSIEDIEYLRRRNEIGKGCNTCY